MPTTLSLAERINFMAYSAEINRANPTCFLFLIDQSGSMQDSWAGEAGKKKADGLATIINKLLQNLVLKCAKSEGVMEYFHVGVIGYGAKVGPAFIGPLVGKDLVSIKDVAEMPARVEQRVKKTDDGAGGLVDQPIKFPIWFDATANGGTPMCQAFAQAETILIQWLAQHPACFPPIVINLSDGESTDGNPNAAADKIKALSSSDGNTILFNVHLSSNAAQPIEFPDSDSSLPDQHAKLLFDMSSPLTSTMKDMAKNEGIKVSEGTRGFVFNADMVSVIRFLDIGTRASNLR